MTEMLRLDLIRMDGGTQPRAAINKELVEEYYRAMKDGAEFLPVTVFHDGTDHWLSDGFHRMHARKRTGHGDIAADVRQGTKRDAILHSLGANATHGQRRTSEDKRRAIERMLSDHEWRGWSDREIARQCAVSPQTVTSLRKARAEARTASAQNGQIADRRTVRRGSATYTMDTSAIGRSAKPAPDPEPAVPTGLGDAPPPAEAAPAAPSLVKKPELHESVSLRQWRALDEATRARLLDPAPAWAGPGFNRQSNDSIGWAWWSVNPVSEHDCVYCYARDIATLGPTAGAFPFGFEPTFYPRRLLAPRHTRQRDAAADWRERNVFVCSMADLFGRWVPDEWIEAVLAMCRAAPEWTFLFLTKFPQRLAEFDLPSNDWYGTTVDLQARVPNAERAFAKIKQRKTWLSVEPMLEPLRFERLDLFQWVVMGGASRSAKSPDWRPPFDWIADLHSQARAAGCRIWHKENLLGSRTREMMDGLPVPQDPQEAPEVFRYLGRRP